MNAARFEAHLEVEIPKPPKETETRFKNRVEIVQIVFTQLRCLACGKRSHMNEYVLTVAQQDTWDKRDHFYGYICPACVQKAYRMIKRKKGPQLIGAVN